jgi:predicted Zn-dependent peptidase
MTKKTTKFAPQLTRLDNGLSIATETMPHVRSVSVGIWIDSGSRREIGDESGISHFIEHMVFKGTTSRSAEQIARSMDALGGHLDAFTGKELVSFNTKVLDEHLEVAFEILADMVLRPVFRKDDIEKEKGVILEELKMELDNPEYMVHETFVSNFWKGHALGQPIIGTKKTIKGFDRGMIGRYYRNVYTPGNIVITAAGNLTHERLVDLVKAQFGKHPSGPKPRRTVAPSPKAAVIIKEKPTLEQVHLMMGVPGLPVGDERRFAAYVMNTLLGGSMSSRLFQKIREQRGLVYTVFSELNSYRDSGMLGVYAGTSRESAPEVVKLVRAEFDDLATNRVPDEELKRSKDHLKGSIMLGLESTTSRMSSLARQQMYFGRFMSMDEMLKSIASVTAEQVQDIAKEFFAGKTVALSAVGRLKGIPLERAAR